ncbi:TetR/AcrR family transcriptional regulator [Conexibacter sp. SYSU D00693]|uniref:TetR/AcrR family transcriptional regulator n=1 Tax=Conexibacter sp. SYSU D00693 TaxID=2812560 RepID=UPI00196A1FD2|nr:TetR/AcrR family transcriptional regulator [Conexibacter sp. SYSU D00693]
MEGTRQDRRRARTAGAILDAARALFVERGVQRTTVDEIAEAADVSVGSVYFHFGSKEALSLALVEQALEVNAAYMAAAEPSDSPLQRVLNAGDAYLRFYLERPDMFRLVALRVAEPEASPELEEVAERIAGRVERLVGAVAADVEAAIAAGEIADDVPPEEAMTFLWGSWNGVIALSLRQDRLRLPPERLAETLALGRRLVLHGLAVAAARPA